MDFSSIVLIERDKENGFVRELDSYNAPDGAEYIKKFYYDGENINVEFGIINDVEDSEFDAIFDNFNVEAFEKEGFLIEEVEDTYNPAWNITFEYKDDYDYIEEGLNRLCVLIFDEMKNINEFIRTKEGEV